MISESSIWFSTDDFAEAAVLTPDGGSPIDCSGTNGVLFNNATAPVNTGDVTIINDNPTAEIQSSIIDATTMRTTQKGTLKITSTNTTWYVIEVGPDIDGFTLLTLSRNVKR